MGDPGSVRATVGVGYAFRSLDAAVDDRAHGAAAVVGLDVSRVWAGFGLRLDGVALAFAGRDVVARPLALVVGGPSLAYAFDDGDVTAIARVGALGGAVVDGEAAAGVLGANAGLLVRLRAGRASHLQADVGLPVVLGDDRFGLQAHATFGVGVSLDALVVGLTRGESLAGLLLPGP